MSRQTDVHKSTSRSPESPGAAPYPEELRVPEQQQRAEMENAPVIRRSQWRGALIGAAVGAVVGAVLGTLIALFPLADLELTARMALFAAVGAMAGSTVGAVMGGGQGPVSEGSAPGVAEGTYRHAGPESGPNP